MILGEPLSKEDNSLLEVEEEECLGEECGHSRESSWEDQSFNSAMAAMTPSGIGETLGMSPINSFSGLNNSFGQATAFNHAANYDSSYDSQSSLCGTDAAAFADAIEQTFILPAGIPKASMPLKPGEAHATTTTGTPVVPVALEPEQAALEFASGIHLIEEMENQVREQP